MNDTPVVIALDDEEKILLALERLFDFEDIPIFCTTDHEQALDMLAKSNAKIFISDYKMPKINGVDVLVKAFEIKPMSKRILLTGQADMSNIVDALNKAHIYRYISKPWDENDLIITVKKAQELYDLERENKHLLVVTQRQLKALEALDKLKSDFIANVSHELRTPVNCLNLVVENILDGVAGDFDNFNPMMQKYVHKAKNNIDNLRAIIDDLLDIFKLSDEDFRLNLQESDLSSLVKNESEAFLELANSKGITLSVDVEDNIDIKLDFKRFGQVMRNLLSNAIKFTDSHGTVNVKAKTCENTVKIEVTDSGKGIPKADLERIFDRFSQVEDKVCGKPIGTGLGLAITKRIVQLHNGIIRAESTLDEGTTFYIDIPLS